MGLISGSGSFTRYTVEDTLGDDFVEGLSDKIARYTFRNLDENSVDERSLGWANIMNMFDNRFAELEFLKEPYIAMSLRVDERKIPATALKQYAIKAEEEIKEKENLEFLPKRRRTDIKDGVRLRLLKRAIPVSKAYDMIWNYNTGQVIFACINNRLCDEFVEFFLQTFNLHLAAVCPYTLGGRVLEQTGASPDILDELGPANLLKEG